LKERLSPTAKQLAINGLDDETAPVSFEAVNLVGIVTVTRSAVAMAMPISMIILKHGTSHELHLS
jgi:hypothetical protein